MKKKSNNEIEQKDSNIASDKQTGEESHVGSNTNNLIGLPNVALYKSESFAGPIPSPILLKEYNDIDPTFANRIIKMSEDKLALAKDHIDHRIALENKMLDHEIEEDKQKYKLTQLGQYAAIIISVLSLSGAFYLALNWNNWGAAIFFGATTASLVGSFLNRLKKSDKEYDDSKNDTEES